jgi:MFS family permease
MHGEREHKENPVLGLKENQGQFFLLVLINAFVGAMIGLERSIFGEMAKEDFDIDGHSAILAFIASFGFSKAVANYFAGRFADKIGRKKLLTIGWLIAIPVPLLIIYAPNWNWVIGSNILLGISQGFTWSSTVVMKIDLVGPKQRGMAMGLNEFSGYLAVGLMAYFTAILAADFGYRPAPFYVALAIAMLASILTILFVKDTKHHLKLEQSISDNTESSNVFLDTTFRNKNLSSTTFAGIVNNMNDGMIWGLFPIMLIGLHFGLKDVGWIAGIYPVVWGISQLFTGKLADIWNTKLMLVWGMIIQGIAIFSLLYLESKLALGCAMAILGIGTALVYPTFFVVISKYCATSQRAESIGVFRFWRDAGYAIGALLSGLLADRFGIPLAIFTIACLTVFSGIVLAFRMSSNVKIPKPI